MNEYAHGGLVVPLLAQGDDAGVADGGFNVLKLAVVVLIIAVCFLVIYQVFYPLLLRRLRSWPNDTFARCTFVVTLILFGVPLAAYWDNLKLSNLGSNLDWAMQAGLIALGIGSAFALRYHFATKDEVKQAG